MAVLVAYGTRTKPQAWSGNGCNAGPMVSSVLSSFPLLDSGKELTESLLGFNKML